MKPTLTAADASGWYLCDVQSRPNYAQGERSFFWNGSALLDYPGGHRVLLPLTNFRRLDQVCQCPAAADEPIVVGGRTCLFGEHNRKFFVHDGGGNDALYLRFSGQWHDFEPEYFPTEQAARDFAKSCADKPQSPSTSPKS